MITLKDNLRFSKDACDYVLNILNVKGANWDQYSGKPSFESCMDAGGTQAFEGLNVFYDPGRIEKQDIQN